MGKCKWTDEQISLIKELLPEHSTVEIAKIFDVSYDAMRSVLKYRGLKRTKEQNAKILNRIMVAHNKLAVGDKNPNWKGGISTDYYRYKKIQQERYPEKVASRKAVYNAIHSGKLQKQPCEFCGDTNVVAHHDDYSKPLEVRWLCRNCHRYKIHDGKF